MSRCFAVGYCFSLRDILNYNFCLEQVSIYFSLDGQVVIYTTEITIPDQDRTVYRDISKDKQYLDAILGDLIKKGTFGLQMVDAYAKNIS
jgi:hypothetical protein